LLIALLATMAVAVGACALASTPARAYQESEETCEEWWECDPNPNPGGESSGGGDTEEGDDTATDESDHQGGYDNVVDPPALDPSLIQQVDDPQSDEAFPNRSAVERQLQTKLAQWANNVRNQANADLRQFDPEKTIWSRHNCDDAFDPMRCGIGWIYLVQVNRCRGIRGVINDQIAGGGGVSAGISDRLGQCEVARDNLVLLLEQVEKLGEYEYMGLPRLGRPRRIKPKT